MKKLILSAIVILGFAAASFAQATATATASGTLVAAVSMGTGSSSTSSSTPASLSFGTIVAGTDGTVVVPGNSANTRSSGTLTLVNGVAVNSAQFTIGGTTGQVYTVTLPPSVNVVNGANNMLVDGFSCDVATAGTSVTGPTAVGTLASATRTFYVGATLHVTAASPVGAYTSTNFNVSVVYN